MVKVISPLLLLILSPNFLFASGLHDEGKWHDNLKTIIESRNFTQIGKATFSVLFWDIYKSKLLTTSGNYPINDDNDKLIYEIKYLKDISSVELLERTVEQWQHIGVETEKYQDYLPLLQQIWPNINKGDTLSLIFDKRSSAFYYNQELIGIVDSPQFGQLFIDIWLAKNTSQPNLRKELLGEHTQQEVNNG